MTTYDRLPLTVLSGFLGAGRTTREGLRAVIVNDMSEVDMSEVDMDAALVRGSEAALFDLERA
ncbi:hypothetical protein ACWC98_27745 [Streptomyces goshikiensis]|uniref:hypothetical protein n=1 Tax=Streptomyces goshikiensis TaxID=1942 RepID=UPI0036B98479